MSAMGMTRRKAIGVTAAAVGGALVAVAAPAPGVRADAGPPTVADWVERHAVRLRTVDPQAPLHDLNPLRRSVGDATIVGLGESTHGAAEEITLKHRTLRLLVEKLGFRSLAWEADWTVGVGIDDYLRTGEGDPEALVRGMATTWRSQEVVAVLRWLREFNAAHPNDQVRFTGVEFFATGEPAYDAVTAYVTRVAPERLADLHEHLRPIEPETPNIGEWAFEYSGLDDEEQQTYIDDARAVYDLVRTLPHRRGDRAHATALHHARQIVYFYEYFAMERGTREMNEYRDSRAARNLRWWLRHSGDKTVYWAATAHTANAPGVTISAPPEGDTRFDSVGSYMRRWYGRRYLSVGFTFDRGTVRASSHTPPYLPEPVRVPSPPAGWADHPLGKVPASQFAVDLRRRAPGPVRAWMTAPTRIRVVGSFDPARPQDFHMTSGSLSQWFDVIVHRQEVTSWKPLTD